MTTSSILERAVVPSKSRPDVAYSMIRTLGGWQHEGEGCPWWLNRSSRDQSKPCVHVLDLERISAMTVDTTLESVPTPDLEGDPGGEVIVYKGEVEVIPPGHLYELIDEFDADLIVAGVADSIVERWCYSFPQEGSIITGLSVHGVSAAVREMAKHGEILQADKPEIVFENDDEIRLTCTVTRYVMDPNEGRRIEMDRQTRALRQTKYQMVNVYEGFGEGRRLVRGADGKPEKVRQDDPKWWEKAFSKAQRNAFFPLLREDCKTAILNAYKETPKYAEIAQGAGRGRGSNNRQVGTSNNRQIAAPTERPPIIHSADSTQVARITTLMKTLKSKMAPTSYSQLHGQIADAYPNTDRLRSLAKLTREEAGLVIMTLEDIVNAPSGDSQPDELATADELSPAGASQDPTASAAGMICPSCGASNETNATVCASCGFR